MRNFRVQKRDQFPAVIIKPVIASPLDPYTRRAIWIRQISDANEVAKDSEISKLRKRCSELEDRIWQLTHQPQLQAMYNLQTAQNNAVQQMSSTLSAACTGIAAFTPTW
jgi:hypothetical protein